MTLTFWHIWRNFGPVGGTLVNLTNPAPNPTLNQPIHHPASLTPAPSRSRVPTQPTTKSRPNTPSNRGTHAVQQQASAQDPPPNWHPSTSAPSVDHRTQSQVSTHYPPDPAPSLSPVAVPIQSRRPSSPTPNLSPGPTTNPSPALPALTTEPSIKSRFITHTTQRRV